MSNITQQNRWIVTKLLSKVTSKFYRLTVKGKAHTSSIQCSIPMSIVTQQNH